MEAEWLVSTFFRYLTVVHGEIHHGEIHFLKNKLYKNNEAEIGKKIRTTLRTFLGSEFRNKKLK